MKKVLLGVCGSSAAYKSCIIIEKLKEQNIDVTVVATESALKFITELSLQTVSGNFVYTTLFNEANSEVSHIEAVRNADLMLIAPATANSIGKMANGICDNMLTTMFLVGNDMPRIIAPAMNNNMYDNPLFKQNLDRLVESGVQLIEPICGELSCGDIAKGVLAEADNIVKQVLLKLENN